MDWYKKIFKSRGLRFKLLQCLAFIPDIWMVKFQYFLKMGKFPNLKNPEKLTEKLQLYKIRYRNTLMPVCADKYEIKKYLESKGYGDNVAKVYGVYDRAQDIDFEKLPNEFVLKTNDGGGGNNVIVCNDKNQLDREETVKKLNSWLDVKKVNPGREWAYTGIKKSRIIAEELLKDELQPELGLSDYKFYCMNGKPIFVSFDGGRYIGRHGRNYYDMDWNLLDFTLEYDNTENKIPKPEVFDEMVEVARRLSADFPFVRVDLYYSDKKIYIGELTFYPYSGYIPFDKEDYDKEYGRAFDISSFA